MEMTIIEETNNLRNFYLNTSLKNSEVLNKLSNSIKTTKHLIQQECVENLLEDIKLNGNKSSIELVNTKKHINSLKDNFVFSVFNAPYFPALNVDAFFYETIMMDDSLMEKYTNNVVPVNMKSGSTGFLSRPVVALFPENHIDKVQHSSDNIFYFINKFVSRFFNITHKMIPRVIVGDFFQVLYDATYNDIEKAAAYWVCLHEYHHRQGFLPIPEYLGMKSLKPLAGLEELRVDICSVIACIEDIDFPEDQADFIYKFILAERLLRYSVEGIPKPNYDAIASQLLFNFLLENEGMTWSNG